MNQSPIEMSVVELDQWMKTRSDVVLIDCREESEYAVAKIDGSVLIPMSRWMESTDKLAEFADKQIVVHCHHGGRSMRVTQWMRANGYPNAINLAGGIDAWSQEIDPNVPRY